MRHSTKYKHMKQKDKFSSLKASDRKFLDGRETPDTARYFQGGDSPILTIAMCRQFFFWLASSRHGRLADALRPNTESTASRLTLVTMEGYLDVLLGTLTLLSHNRSQLPKSTSPSPTARNPSSTYSANNRIDFFVHIPRVRTEICYLLTLIRDNTSFLITISFFIDRVLYTTW